MTSHWLQLKPAIDDPVRSLGRLAIVLTVAWPGIAPAQDSGSSEEAPRLVIDATATEIWDVGALTPAELDELERRRALLGTDDPGWSRELGGKWAVGANERLNDPIPASGREDNAPVGLKLERRF